MFRRIYTYPIYLISFMTLAGCSSVRDYTDWVPGVDSNEEIQAQQQQEAKKLREKERTEYADRAVFTPLVSDKGSEMDAKISVSISRQFSQEADLDAHDIGIEVNNRVVTLSGSVASEAEAVKAIALSKSTAGVTRVISKLIIINLRKS